MAPLWARLSIGSFSTFASSLRLCWICAFFTGTHTKLGCARRPFSVLAGLGFPCSSDWECFIFAGSSLHSNFSWVLYVLGGFLVYAGIRMFFKKEDVHPEKSRIVGFAGRHLRLLREYNGEKFFVRKGGKWFATPLLLVLLVVEITDVTLAVDSIPAVFGITRDPFIVYTSNVLAILGLRALYFLLAGVIDRLRYLDEGLAVVLVFIGGKMIGEQWVHIPETVSLGVVGGVLLIALLASV